jgi:cation-transporting ATPase 13A1
LIPHWYDATHKKLAREGYRVLALCSKSMQFETRAKLVLVDRDDVESDLIFCGFLVTCSPLKDDTPEVIKELRES